MSACFDGIVNTCEISSFKVEEVLRFIKRKMTTMKKKKGLLCVCL